MYRLFLFSVSVFILSVSLLSAAGNFENSKEDTQIEYADMKIIPETKIRKVENGFTTVLYQGDYGFDYFLSRGGADSDEKVLNFLTENLLSEAEGLSFEGSVFGCSTISVSSLDGGYLFGRNFDWMKCDIMVVQSLPDNGYGSISTVNMDFIRQETGVMFNLMPDRILAVASLYAPLDGMNEKGLCVAVNMIEDYSTTIDQRSAKPDITTSTLIRLLLDKASDVDEALNLLDSYDLHASFGYMVHFAIADASGRSVAVEYVNNEMKIIDTPILTNFYLAEGEKQGIGSAQSHERYRILDEIINNNYSMNEADVRDALSRVSKKNFEEFLSTEWSIVFDQENLKAQYFHREDYTKSYSFYLNGDL